ncbi:MAG: cbb3-type cytochrome oxidase assembly protein CcoS [Pseudomonadota bacterium]|nr:cbb3-type cytochrome oxidase assembly protein CcoS [Pseudomonadota bacterium]
MNIIFVLIPLSAVLVLVAIAAFFWAVRSGQFDDLDSPAYRILLDDESTPDEDSNSENRTADDRKP